jgi:hypothetical protein
MAIDLNNIPNDHRVGTFFILRWEMPNGKIATNLPLGVLYGEHGDPDLIPESTVQHYIDEYNQEIVNLDSLEYLKNTDWYVVREQDGGSPVPDDVRAERAACRNRMVRTEFSKW